MRCANRLASLSTAHGDTDSHLLSVAEEFGAAAATLLTQPQSAFELMHLVHCAEAAWSVRGSGGSAPASCSSAAPEPQRAHLTVQLYSHAADAPWVGSDLVVHKRSPGGLVLFVVVFV